MDEAAKAGGEVLSKAEIPSIEIGSAEIRTLQTGGNTLSKATLKALGLSKEEGKIAMEALKRDLGLPADFNGKIMSKGDLIHPNTKEVLGNLLDYIN